MEIELRAAGVTINGLQALTPMTMTVESGQLVALAGASGSGKTTLLNVLGLLRRPSTGQVLVDGVDATRWSDTRRRGFWRQHAAFIFQDYGLIDEESAAYNVALHTLSPWRRHRYRGDSRVVAALDAVGLAERAGEEVARLSGGERQRVGIARALYRGADAIFADEPTASLDGTNMELISGYLRREADRGTLVVVATHDEELIQQCDAVHVLDSRLRQAS